MHGTDACGGASTVTLTYGYGAPVLTILE